MENKIMLGDFIFSLRKEKNLSQADLGNLVGVSNKAVSKWETYEANPDLQIIPKLAEVLGVTTDELLACKKTEPKHCMQNESTFIGIKGSVDKGEGYYEFTSEKKTKKGTPYLHINIGKDANGKIRKAKGIIALGIISRGIISAGIISCGVLSLGIISIGLIALGVLNIGLIVAVGVVSIGVGVSVGSVAVGTIAVGGVAIGVLSVGGLSIGVWAHTGGLGEAIGIYKIYHLL